MFDNLQKISLLSVESLFFSKELLLFLKHLEKVTLVLTPSPPIKMSFLFTHSKFDFFLRPPPLFAQCPQINTTEETFQSDIIDSTIFQTNSFDVLSEFALLVSSTTCSAYSSVLSNESEKMFQQNFQNNLFHLNKFDNDSEFFGQRNCCSADCVAGPA